MQRVLIDLLACPSCHCGLRYEGPDDGEIEVTQGEVICPLCESHFFIREGVPQMLLPQGSMKGDHWKEWMHKQAQGLQDYTFPDMKTKAYFDGIAEEFGRFCDLRGLILDVGCGIGPHPAYAILSPDNIFIGLDPMEGHEKKEIDFVRGIGEAIPFRSAAFDWALSAASLDHFPEPQKVLAEVKRVLRPTGRMGLWVGVYDPDYLRRKYAWPSLSNGEKRAHLWNLMRQGELPRLAKALWRHLILNRIQSLVTCWRQRRDDRKLIKDMFKERAEQHFNFFKKEEVLKVLSDAGYQVIKHHLIASPDHGNSFFIVAAPLEEV